MWLIPVVIYLVLWCVVMLAGQDKDWGTICVFILAMLFLPLVIYLGIFFVYNWHELNLPTLIKIV